jgi:hypothetical protein
LTVDEAQFAENKAQKAIQFYLLIGFTVTLFLGVLFQTKHTLLYDYSYLVNISGRMLQGEMPYRDFDLVVSPGIFFLQAIFLGIIGKSSFSVLILSLVISLSCYYLASRILLEHFIPKIKNKNLLKTYQIIVILIVSLLGVNWIISFPIYDALGVMLILINITVILNLKDTFKSLSLFSFGLTLSLTLFAKQNIGFGYILGGVGLLVIILAKSGLNITKKIQKFSLFFLGLVTTPGVFLLFLIKNEILNEYIFQNFRFASEVKSLTVLSVLTPYKEPSFVVLLMLSCVAILIKKRKFVFVLQATPILLGGLLASGVIIASLFFGIYEFKHINWPLVIWLWILAPLLLVAINEIFSTKYSRKNLSIAVLLLFGLSSTYISHGYKGSSYATGPLFALACVLVCFEISKRFQLFGLWCLVSALVISVWFPIYALSAHRYASPVFAKQSYSYLRLSEPVSFIAIPTKTEKDLSDLIFLLKSSSGTVLQLPAEDPLFLFSPDLKPWSRCTQYIFMTCTLNDKKVLERFLSQPPSFLIIKNEIQLEWNPEPVSSGIQSIAERCFKKVLQNPTYSVFTSEKHESNLRLCQ